MSQAENLLNRRFDRLLVIGPADPVPRGRKLAARWRCRCDCGNERDVRAEDLKSSNSRSCGCIQREKARARFLTHGASKSQMYGLWTQMKQRCLNPDDERYPRYGGRGITVCDRWKDSFEAFVEDMGLKPPGRTLDRINNDGNYERANCRWAKPAIQSRNRRCTIWAEYNGERLCAADIAKAYGVSSKRVYKVISTRGLSVVEACEYVRDHRRPAP